MNVTKQIGRLVPRICLIAVLCCLGGGAARAQNSGGIMGLVKDSSGAVIPGVTVEASSPALIEHSRTAVTDSQGRYSVVDLRPGTYAVTFTLSGFETVKREGVALSAGFTATVNADLTVGNLAETVTISGAAPVVDVANTRTQVVLPRAELDAIPAAKTFNGYVALIPGVRNTSALAGRDVGGVLGEPFQGLSAHGSDAGLSMMDGITTISVE